MSDPLPPPSAVPWLAAEAILLRLTQLQPPSVYVCRDQGERIVRHLRAADPDESVPWQIVRDSAARTSCVVWVGDGVTASADARTEVLAIARNCDHDLLMCEPLAPGCGIGLSLLRAIDPKMLEIETDEVADGPGRTRERKPWEPRGRWAVAHASAWRFEGNAELAREGFIARLPRMSVAEMVLDVRRLLSRFPRGHELLVLAIAELARRRDEDGARQLAGEFKLQPGAAPSHLAAARRTLLGAFPPAIIDGWDLRPTGS